MGLDWNPGNKPKPGFEQEFERLFNTLQKKRTLFRRRRTARFQEISVSAFETLDAPQVGHSSDADAWALEQYRRSARDVSEEVWLQQLNGLYVVDLVSPCDGIPPYSNGAPGAYVEPFSFRAQFLTDCEYIIGSELLGAAYQSKLAAEFAAYGNALSRKFDDFARERGLDPSNLHLQSDDPESAVFHADVVGSAARWCLFWSRHGHVLEAYW